MGSLAGNILRLSGPMTLALLINLLYSVVDRMYIGHMAYEGRIALTGIGLAFPIIAIITAFQSLCSMGGAPLLSIARGEGDDKRAELIMGNSFAMLVGFGIILTVLGFIFKAPVLRLIGASDNTFGYANDYLTIYLIGTVFVMISLGMNPFINAQGFAKTGMFTVLIGAVTNIVLDPVFIFALNMGVKGAALATVIAQCISAVWVFRFLTGKKAILKLRPNNLRLRVRVVSRTLSLGLTGFTMAITNSAVSILYNSTLRNLGGDVYVGAMTVINSVREIVHMPLSGLMGGAQPVLGYNYGAKEYMRVREGIKIQTMISIVYTVMVSAIILAVPQLFIRIFNTDRELLAVGIPAIRAFFCAFFMMAFQIAGQNAFISLGKAKEAVFFSLFRKVIILIPLILFMPTITGMGTDGIFLAEPLSDIVGGIACFSTMMFTVYRRLKTLEEQKR
ncbi:MAG: MATE family efflux transporter [Clostridiales bacterium]|nr:MATE family efflux transporter [Clostridiales bacterium]